MIEAEESDVVRLMTIHQAKGLQFDVVVLPELDAQLTGQTPQVVVGRPKPAAPADRVCRYVARRFEDMAARYDAASRGPSAAVA